mmetsp:Transcript_40654/g.115027  ORF Transcript_40654/g.115027 Transcript_40654/m.115027 type:complete len:207 (+) Transcript_40654:259-879(+)
MASCSACTLRKCFSLGSASPAVEAGRLTSCSRASSKRIARRAASWLTNMSFIAVRSTVSSLWLLSRFCTCNCNCSSSSLRTRPPPTSQAFRAEMTSRTRRPTEPVVRITSLEIRCMASSLAARVRRTSSRSRAKASATSRKRSSSEVTFAASPRDAFMLSMSFSCRAKASLMQRMSASRASPALPSNAVRPSQRSESARGDNGWQS